MWAAAIVMRDPLVKPLAQVPVTEWNHEVAAFASDRADQAFAECVRLRCPKRRLEYRHTHRRQRAIHVADHGVQWVDYNNDGGLDLSVTRGYTTTGGHFLFRNTLPESVKRRSLEVTGSMRRGAGPARRKRQEFLSDLESIVRATPSLETNS
jgi:hypothetical protein